MTTPYPAGSGEPPTQEIPAVTKVAVRPRASNAAKGSLDPSTYPPRAQPGPTAATEPATSDAAPGPTAIGTATGVPAAHPAPSSARPVAPPRPAPAAGRRIRLTVSRVDPWSALKMSFLLSVAIGIAMVVATASLWLILDGMGAFTAVNDLVGKIVVDNGQKLDILDFVGFKRVISLAIVTAVVDVFLWTAVATLGAFIYNVSSSLVGGLQLTLTDD